MDDEIVYRIRNKETGKYFFPRRAKTSGFYFDLETAKRAFAQVSLGNYEQWTKYERQGLIAPTPKEYRDQHEILSFRLIQIKED